MPRLCERPGCSAPASVAYGFEAERFLVWVESVPVDLAAEIRSGVLCRRHADALSPPRGWWLDDRRDPTPQLFREPHRASNVEQDTGHVETARTVASPRVRQRSEKRSRRDADITVELPFDSAAIEALALDDHASAVGERPSELTVSEGSGAPGVSPATSVTIEGSSAVFVEVPDPDETKAIPWSPHFDQSDDLDGLLNVRSPLLSRAFRGRRGTTER